jgi:hypothetical protein
MGVNRLISRLFSLVVFIKVVGAYLSTADEDLVLIDEGPGRWSGSTCKESYFIDEFYLDNFPLFNFSMLFHHL